MSLISPNDIAFAVKDFAGTCAPNVRFGAQRCYGDLKSTDDMHGVQGGATLIVRTTTLVVAQGALTGVTEDSQLTVDGAAYLVRVIEPQSDGSVHYLLAEKT